jgi:hypothetical protein
MYLTRVMLQQIKYSHKINDSSLGNITQLSQLSALHSNKRNGSIIMNYLRSWMYIELIMVHFKIWERLRILYE